MLQSQQNGSSEFVRHDPCPDCGSSDGLAVYTDGHQFCFVCHTWTPGNGSQSSPRSSMNMTLKGSANRLKKRDISEKTCERFKIYSDGEVLRFYYHDNEGRVVGAKTRTANKIFSYEGDSPGNFLDRISGKVMASESRLLRASLMLPHVSKSHPLGMLFHCQMAQLQQRSRFKRIYSGCKAMMRLSSSLMPMNLASKLQPEAASILPPGKGQDRSAEWLQGCL